MKLKLNHFERVAGVFVLLALLGFFLSVLTMAFKQGWFESKVSFTAFFVSAEGVHPGVTVQMSGLQAGQVETVELTADNRVKVHFSIYKKFHERIRKDSYVQLVRPFIIGERVLDVTVGSPDTSLLEAEAVMTSRESVDLITLLSGKGLSRSLSEMSEMLGSLRRLLEAFLDRERTESFIATLDRLEPLVKNLNSMSVEVTKLAKQTNQGDQLKVVLQEVAQMGKGINYILPELTEKAPHLAKDMRELVENLNSLTREFKSVIPALNAVAPELPRTSKRAVEALDEAVVLMKALQKSFLLRGNVREVRQTESEERAPAQDISPKLPEK
jgi:phospholipid/cholesterol/gamma-HCH transport system substrate-binding protein